MESSSLSSASVMEERNEGLKLKNRRLQLKTPERFLGIKMKHCNRLPGELRKFPVLDAPGNGQICKRRYIYIHCKGGKVD